ncbi:hypothetical protein [Kangiella spongicola]|uniref:DUF4062 domain-containing protein n=1 Tax=Kangiella spongicola TaxID=796379 RepID=A0A318DBM6_9GAMM|nr:hypothetical protein [Kangiella spongicola]PXF64347.1 hypothetical protein DL796_04190 [Kangiella spongicola]
MAYQATVIPVMIASPGDVAEERELIRNIIHDWNDVNAENSNVMLSGIGWETHSSPELGARPQELINKRILKNCDLLIGVFWTRLGTPTGKSSSGTVEEIEEHVAAGKPAMIYFSSKPVAPQSIDTEQFAKVQEIKQKWMPQGLIETYDNLEEFQKKLSKQLQLCLSKNEYLRGLVSATKDEVTPNSDQSSQQNEQYRLSQEAKTLLRSASSRDDGTILKMAYIGGRVIQAGGESFGGERGREAAKWEAALDELLNLGLVTARGFKGEVFELTNKGWEVADAL